MYNPFESWTSEGLMVLSNVVVALATAVTTYFLVADRIASSAREKTKQIIAQENQRLIESGRVIGPKTPFVTARTSNGAACVLKIEFEVERYSRESDDLKDFEVRPAALEILAPYLSVAVRAHTSTFALPNSLDAEKERDSIIAAVVPASDDAFKRRGLHLSSLKFGPIVCTKDLL